MDTSLLFVAQLELVMINVLSVSKLAPSMTFERLVCHQDVAFVICVTPQDVTPILFITKKCIFVTCSLDTTCTRGLNLCSKLSSQ